MNEHLLMLDALHAAAPGVLDVVFGPDGAHKNAPLWMPSAVMLGVCYDRPFGRHAHGLTIWDAGQGGWYFAEWDQLALDLLTPSTACRIAGLCLRAGADHNALNADLCWEIIAEAMDNRIHPETAARMVAITLRLAPKIAALKVA